MKPDFESGKGYYWMKQMKALMAIPEHERPKNWPRRPRSTPAEKDFFGQVDRRLGRQSFTVGVTFDKEGRIIKE